MHAVFLDNSLGSRGYRFRGPEDYALLGVVSSAGDVNGDGIDDFIVAGNANDSVNGGSGYTYVIYGRRDGQFGAINLASLAGADGFRIHGIAGTAGSNLSVASAGDFNGDGYDDIIIGGVNNSNGGAWVVFGSATGRPSVELASLTASQGFFIKGPNGDSAGFSVSSAGDINHDGYDDIIVGSPDDSTDRQHAGQAHIIFGKASGFGTIDLANFPSSAGFVIRGDSADEFVGYDVASAGDVNGDGIDDLTVSAPLASEGNGFQNGAIYLVYGKTTPFGTINLATLGGSDGAIISGSFQAGYSVAGAGDVNADGYADVIIGAPMENGNHGRVYVVFGKAGGIGSVNVATMTAAQGFRIDGGEFDRQTGYTVAGAGDVNGDGYDDLLFSAPFGGNGGNSWVILGKADITSFNLDDMNVADPPQGFRMSAESGIDAIGRTLSSAGDVNDDGVDDILVGSRDNNGGGFARGASYLVFGLLPTTAVTLTGTLASQHLTGGNLDDQLYGLGGDDRLRGNGGADLLDGGAGNDVLKGDAGDDTLYGGDGDDLLYGGAGADTVYDDAGNDTAFITGGITKADTDVEAVNLGSDLDRLVVDYSQMTEAVVMANPAYSQFGAQTTFEVGGAVRISALNLEAVTVTTGSGNDVIYGLVTPSISLVDEISTGAGNDSIRSGYGAGIDRIDGGSGIDTAIQVDWSDLSQAIVLDLNLAAGITLGTGQNQRWLRGIEQLINFSAGSGNDVIALNYDATLRNAISTLGGSDTVTYHGGATAATTAAGSNVDMGTAFSTDDDLLIVDFASATQRISFGAVPQIDATDVSGTIMINGMIALNFQGVERLFLTTGTGNDELYGTIGADSLNGGAGADTMAAGTGNDTYYVDNAGDQAVEAAGEGNDIVYASASWMMTAGSSIELLSAASLSGTTPLTLVGNEFAQTIYGNAGGNFLNGLGGADIMVGLAGDDTYFVDNVGDQTIENAGEGTDIIYSNISYQIAANASVELLSPESLASTTALTFIGNSQVQLIYGNAGANTLTGGGGADRLVGYGGDDVYIITDGSEQVFEAAGGGNDIVYTQVSHALAGGQEIELLSAANNSATTAMDLSGNEFANTIYGNNGVNNLRGGGGNGDKLIGLGGNDVYFIVTGDEQLFEAVGGGNDVVYTNVSHALVSGQEIEVLAAISIAATNAIDLSGNEYVNTIYGNNGVNNLRGGGGADTMVGFGGNDIYYILSGTETVIEAASGGFDTVYTNLSYTLGTGQQIEILSAVSNSATTAMNLTGNELVNTIYGNNGANIIDGGGGSDVLQGFGGNDTYIVDNDDVVVEGTGGGFDTVAVRNYHVLAAHAEVELLTTIDQNGTAAITLWGNELSQTVIGNAGANQLNGGGGTDTLRGLGGQDVFVFNTELGADNVDTILDFVSVDDIFFLDHNIFTGLPASGFIDGLRFSFSGVAADADDRIIYNQTTGELFFDPDGTGAHAQILFAILTGAPMINSGDFQMI